MSILESRLDITSLFSFLPDKLKKNISKNCQFEVRNITSLNSAKVELVKTEIAGILYATRNSIVHAKSNYSVTGKECLEDDFEQLNIFMARLCECLFVWNGRQSKEFKLK